MNYYLQWKEGSASGDVLFWGYRGRRKEEGFLHRVVRQTSQRKGLHLNWALVHGEDHPWVEGQACANAGG